MLVEHDTVDGRRTAGGIERDHTIPRNELGHRNKIGVGRVCIGAEACVVRSTRIVRAIAHATRHR